MMQRSARAATGCSQPPAVMLGIALVTSVALYAVFERMFQVSLPHGLLGAALDF